MKIKYVKEEELDLLISVSLSQRERERERERDIGWEKMILTELFWRKVDVCEKKKKDRMNCLTEGFSGF